MSQPMQKGASSNGTSRSASKAQMKNCIAEQRTNNPSMSKHDVKKYCESQLNGSPQSE
jgi:hypothetical protein